MELLLLTDAELRDRWDKRREFFVRFSGGRERAVHHVRSVGGKESPAHGSLAWASWPHWGDRHSGLPSPLQMRLQRRTTDKPLIVPASHHLWIYVRAGGADELATLCGDRQCFREWSGRTAAPYLQSYQPSMRRILSRPSTAISIPQGMFLESPC